jgi:aminopeptidase N
MSIKPAIFRAIALFLGATCVFSAGFVGAAPDPSWDSIPGDLPKHTIPHHYTISILPDIEAKTFKGTESIDLEVRTPVSTVVLNARKLGLSNARLAGVAGQTAAIQMDDRKETATLTFSQPLPVGRHQLELEFQGQIGSQAEGLYYGTYPSNEGEKVLLATQLEPTDARQVFPCWDEPAFRATFQLIVEVPEKFLAVSNMPVEREEALPAGKKRVKFSRTPKMPSYLVVLVAGELEALSGEAEGIPLRIITSRGKKQNGEYALEVTRKLLAFFNDYFGLKYPLPKLDQIAIPGGFLGAMENWGAITYFESILLFDPKVSSQSTRETIFNVVAHEIAHQWFGDLVTPAWWDDLWLNEAFATWMEVKASNHFNPGWNARVRSGRSKNFAMSTDALRATHPVRMPIANPSDVIRSFDEITYQKGGAVLFMLETYLGEQVFRDGLRQYLSAHQYGNATAANLWTAMEKVSGKPLSGMARSWIEQPGFPLLKVSSSCLEGKRQLVLEQQRFTLDDEAPSPLLWQIPVILAEPGATQPPKKFLLKEKSSTFALDNCSTTIKLNAGDAGYYRVRYSKPLLKVLRESLSSGLGQSDQLNLLRDTWALMEANQGSSSDYLDLVEGLRDQKGQPIWEEILGKLESLDSLFIGNTARDSLHRYGRSLLAPLLKQVGWESQAAEPEENRLLRTRVITMLGFFGDEGVIAQARSRFQLFQKNPGSLNADLRPAVLDVVGRYCDRVTYDRLHELGRQAQNLEERLLFYRAMHMARDPLLADENLSIALTDELPPGVAAYSVFNVAFGGQHREAAWTFVRQNLKKLTEKLDLWGRLNYVPYLMTAFSDAARAEELEAFSKEHLSKDAGKEVAKAAEKIRFQARLKARELPRIDEWLRHRSLN